MSAPAAATPSRLTTYAGFVKLEHTLFSLPLIYAGAWLGGGPPSLRLAGLMLLAAIGGRVMAMGLNRLIDVEIDARNPRTQRRELPSGALQRAEAWGIVAAAGGVYLIAAASISHTCLWFSPIPVALFVGYPYLKRFTSLAHLGLGLAWSMAPLGGWVAAASSLSHIGQIGWLWLFSLLWVAGFDIIYATMDEAFDRQAGLYSMPARLGAPGALRIASILHAAAFIALAILWGTAFGNRSSLVWLGGVGVLFIWQHMIADREPEFAFFTLNGILGFLVLGFIVSGLR